MDKKTLSQADMVSAILKNQNPDEYLKQLDGLSWCELRRKNTEFMNQFWDKSGEMDGCDWSLLLSKYPDDFQSVCEKKEGWTVMKRADWALLLAKRPGKFEEEYKKWGKEKMDGLDSLIDRRRREQESSMEEKVKSSVFDFSFGGALRDATLRKAYTGHKQKLIESGQMLAVKLLVRDYIDTLLKGEFKNDDSKKHEDYYQKLTKNIGTILSSCSCFQDFVFGNIQKLVNMTAKYIYVACYAKQDKDMRDMRACFQFCHCPMDSVMIKTVTSDYNGEKRKNVKWGEVRWSKITGDLASPTSSTTDTIKPESIDVYIQFQEMVKELSDRQNIYPIEYDFLNWKRDDDETKNLCTPVPPKSLC